jgi:sugar phosphate isomerase/epimerase
MTYSRRNFGKLALTSLPVAAAAFTHPSLLLAAEKPNSKFNGVQIGVITAYSYHNMPGDAASVLSYLVQNGVSATEMENTQEQYAGAPKPPPFKQAAQMTPADAEERKNYQAELLKWRLSAPMEKYTELRKMYNDAGVNIYGFKITLDMGMPDAAYDYAFKAAKLCGSDQITMEMPEDPALTKRMGEFGSKYKMMVGYHAHLQAKPDTWDQAMAQSPYNGINIDMGHYTAAGNHDQLAFIRKNHARITSMHLKDRRYPENGGKNMPWGEGDTPIKEILQLVKKEGYKFPCTVELEYPVPAGSTSVVEVGKCVAFSKAALA